MAGRTEWQISSNIQTFLIGRRESIAGPLRALPAVVSRGRAIMATAAAVAVVALFVALLRGFAPVSSTGGSRATVTPRENQAVVTSTAATTMLPGWFLGLPVIAPSDSRVIYQMTASHQLRRSDNGGATWRTLDMPSGAPSGASDARLLVDQQNAQTVMLLLTVYGVPAGMSSCPTPLALSANGNMMAGGQIPCTLQYLSHDGGQTWSLLHLPFTGVLGDASVDTIEGAAKEDPLLRAQGQRLYSYVGSGPFAYSAGFRLATSTDGGAAWRLADADLAANGQHVCYFAVAPTGSDVFAITSSTGCGASDNPVYAFWRGADAGGHWIQMSYPADKGAEGLFAAGVPGVAQPVIYADTAVATFTAHIGGSVRTAPTDIAASTDGGRTWQSAPQVGIPANSFSSYGPLGTLADGSILLPIGDVLQSQPGTLTPTVFYEWKPGETSWHRVGAASLYGRISYGLVTGHSAAQTIWIVTAVGNVPANAMYKVMVIHLP